LDPTTDYHQIRDHHFGATNHGEGGIFFSLYALVKKDKIKWSKPAIIGGSDCLQTELLFQFHQQWKELEPIIRNKYYSIVIGIPIRTV
jgi:hypothetical protein